MQKWQEVTAVRMPGLSRWLTAMVGTCALLAVGTPSAQAAPQPPPDPPAAGTSTTAPSYPPGVVLVNPVLVNPVIVGPPPTATPAPGVAAPGAGAPAVPAPAAAAATAASPAGVPADPSECTSTAGEKLGWGKPDRESDFQDGLPPDWHPYGPEPGHAKNGTRTPDAITVADGNVTITATQDGTTGAMSWHPGQRYGRWEGCVKSDAGKGGINALFLLWPVAEDFPVGGEIDWMEIGDDTRQETSFFLHYGQGNEQTFGSVRHDATKWSAYALEWTPEKITAYVDGVEWYSTTDTDKFPPRPMNMTMQLDYFGGAGGGTAMHMDWAKQWALPQSEPATLSLGPGDPATGQPHDYPERAPRTLDTPAARTATGSSATPGSAGPH